MIKRSRTAKSIIASRDQKFVTIEEILEAADVMSIEIPIEKRSSDKLSPGESLDSELNLKTLIDGVEKGDDSSTFPIRGNPYHVHASLTELARLSDIYDIALEEHRAFFREQARLKKEGIRTDADLEKTKEELDRWEEKKPPNYRDTIQKWLNYAKGIIPLIVTERSNIDISEAKASYRSQDGFVGLSVDYRPAQMEIEKGIQQALDILLGKAKSSLHK
jgi:hypothetical protein